MTAIARNCYGLLVFGRGGPWYATTTPSPSDRLLRRPLGGRLAALRAELELEEGRFDDAMTWVRRAIETAVSTRRRKYEVVSRITLGRVLSAQGEHDPAVRELHPAVEAADALGSPLFRWQSRAALGEAQKGSWDERADAESTLKEAVAIVHEVADSLSAERSAAYLAAPQVVSVLELAR